MSGPVSFNTSSVTQPSGHIVLFALIPIFALIFFSALLGYSIGEQNGFLKYWKAEIGNCVRTEDRQFADTGFLFFSGSGEITTINVCVEWVVKR
jgi:hypothetical protein